MSFEVPTVKVVAKSERGWRIINQSDFDPSVHQVYGKAAGPSAAEAAEGTAPKRGHGRPRKA